MELQETNYQIFTEVMEYIFDASTYQDAPTTTAKEVVQIISSKKRKIDKDITKLNKNILKDDMMS